MRRSRCVERTDHHGSQRQIRQGGHLRDPIVVLRQSLSSQRHAAVGLATVFTSHAWKYLFLDVIDALLYHFQDEPGIVVWFDLFSNNQHKAVDLDFHWWCNTLKTAIEQFGRTVMVLSPWQDPIPLTRGWCLFELYCTVATNRQFEVAMSKEHQ